MIRTVGGRNAKAEGILFLWWEKTPAVCR